ncbi:MAG: serine/threonine-protein kinase [Kofleriaceae bacterium]
MAVADDGDDDETVASPPPTVDVRARRLSRPSAPGLHEDATQAPSAGAATGGPDSLSAFTTSPAEALRLDEILRTRVFLKLALVVVVAALVAIVIADGDPVAKTVVALGCGVIAVVAPWMLWVTREPEGYTTRRIVIVAIAGGLGASSSLVYWGAASPATAVILFGIYFFSLGTQPGVTVILYALCAASHLGFSALVIAGAADDPGLVPLTALAVRDQVATTLVVQVLFAVAFVTGRASRRTTLAAVSRLDAAVRVVSQREAVLAEVRQELDRALKLGGPGRYTDQVVGSFRLGPLIGRGGMGEVYEAVHTGDGSAAAVKLLHPSTLADAHHVERFVREAELVARLDCPHIVAVREVGTTAGELPYLAMERLRGHDLAHYLRRRRAVAPSLVVELVRDVAIGLEAARNAGVVHRDLKPHNLFAAEVGGRRRWKILDFGVSKAIGSQGTLTGGHVVGTPAFMAPEQARGEEVDHRADVYALAAIAYRALCGQPPHRGRDVPSTLHDVVYGAPRQPSALATLPVDLDRVLALGLAKARDDRFATAAEFAQALAAATAGSLDDALRARADAVLRRSPWATTR